MFVSLSDTPIVLRDGKDVHGFYTTESGLTLSFKQPTEPELAVLREHLLRDLPKALQTLEWVREMYERFPNTVPSKTMKACLQAVTVEIKSAPSYYNVVLAAGPQQYIPHQDQGRYTIGDCLSTLAGNALDWERSNRPQPNPYGPQSDLLRGSVFGKHYLGLHADIEHGFVSMDVYVPFDPWEWE